LPEATRSDWRIISSLPDGHCDEDSVAKVQRLSFYSFLQDRLLVEAGVYAGNKFHGVILENVAAPYFIRGNQPPVIYLVMAALAIKLREEYPALRIGIQILAYSDDWAMDIACRYGLDFIRCESALFEGVRPEGRTPNTGNLAKLYLLRNMLMASLARTDAGPQVYVDVRKKHTVFMPSLESLAIWLDNILFQKLEGVIITGHATGAPADVVDFQQAREAIDKAKADSFAATGLSWELPLIVGSGASLNNIAMCKRYADAVIVGSALKRKGYWECPLDEERVKRFMEEWNK
jgi:predicted TIM-barrel enzyme